MKFTEE